VESQRRLRRERPEISGRLRGFEGERCAARAQDTELLEAGLEGGRVEAEELGGAARAADTPAVCVKAGPIFARSRRTRADGPSAGRAEHGIVEPLGGAPGYLAGITWNAVARFVFPTKTRQAFRCRRG
jgi:hypothetical protein